MNDSLKSVAPLVVAAFVGCAGLLALCIRPDESATIKDVVGGVVLICGTAWQAGRPQQPPASP
jgi:hypothetical protein